MAGPAIVACASLEPVIESIDPSVEARYVSHELHESPLGPGDERLVHERLQEAIDAVSDPSVFYVAIAYARSSISIDRLDPRDSPLVVWQAVDCADALCGRSPDRFGEAKAAGTYYLTPGSIERGVDPYKAYLAYTGACSELLERHRKAGLTPTWQTGPRISQLRTNGPQPAESLLLAQFREQFGSYDRVVLLDTGSTLELHRSYAESLADFLERIRGKSVAFDSQPATLAAVKQLLDVTALDTDRVDILHPESDDQAAAQTPLTHNTEMTTQ